MTTGSVLMLLVQLLSVLLTLGPWGAHPVGVAAEQSAAELSAAAAAAAFARELEAELDEEAETMAEDLAAGDADEAAVYDDIDVEE